VKISEERDDRGPEAQVRSLPSDDRDYSAFCGLDLPSEEEVARAEREIERQIDVEVDKKRAMEECTHDPRSKEGK